MFRIRLLLCVASAMLAARSASGQATVTTNESDYPPGATVYISGQDFWALENVVVDVARADGTPLHDGHDPWLVTADALGAFDTSWVVCAVACVDATLEVTATGQQSGLVATAQFTDAPGVFIELTSQETLWVDANKCGDEGPQGAWLSFLIHNSSGDGTVLNNVSVTFNGFTNVRESGLPFVPANPPLFVPPTDTVRTFTSIADGDAVAVYYYVDYSEVCNNPQGGGSPYDSFTADYTITVMSDEITDVRNGTVSTDELITASAAGMVGSITLGPGLYVGQVFTQDVTYVFGNNTNLFFQPAAEADFVEDCMRLVGSEITAVTGNADPGLVGQNNRLHFPLADVAGAGGTITVTFFWEVLCVDTVQTVSPWAAARSGGQFKYTAIAENPEMFPEAEIPIEIAKSVSPASLDDDSMGPVTWTVTISNTSPVEVIVSSVTDEQPACMTVADPDAAGSDIIAANSASIPMVGATGTLQWVGLDFGPLAAATTYRIAAMSAIDLVYTSDVLGCGDGSFTNSAIARVGSVDVGPAEATVSIGDDPPVCDANGPYEEECASSMTDVVLDGTGSFDPEGGMLTYLWSGSPAFVSFDDATSATPTASVTLPPDVCNVTVIVTLQVTDPSGQSTSCQATITIVDTTPPAAPPFPADVMVQCAADVPPPMILAGFDACRGTIEAAPVDVTQPGDCPNSFTITRTWTFDDGCTVPTQVQQTITVDDTTAPMLTCPTQDIIVPNDTGQCGGFVGYSVTAVDNCDGAVTPVCSMPSGSLFPVGTTTVTCTATDACGNEAQCSFDVIVNDVEPPVAMCPEDIVVGNDPGQCDAVVNFTATVNDNCPGATVTCSPASGSTFPVGTTLVTCTAADAAGNQSQCSFLVFVDDTEPPVASCPADITVSNDPGECSAVVSFAATVSDNCPAAVVSCSPPSGTDFPVGTTTVTCTATDNAGNQSQCSFTVTVNDTEPPMITCPSPITTGTDPALCGATVMFITTATDNCPTAPTSLTVTCTPASGSFFPVGTTTVTCTATDDAGNVAQCSFDVIVNDVEPPVAMCPEDIVVGNDPGQCDAVVNFTATVNDNCPGATVTCSPASGSTFPVGTTLVTCTAADAAGNQSQCSFLVFVDDTEPPVASCPADITVSNDPGECSAVVSFAATVSDNCPAAVVSCSPPSGTDFPVGTTTVTCTATDSSGNQSQCSFDVTVNDTEPPVANCPSSITVDNDPGQCGAVVDFVAFGSDNCPGVDIVCTATDGTFFPVGVTTVTCTATDAAGNQSQCVFDVTVNDTEPPTLACPISGLTENEPGQCGAVITYPVQATDNCVSGVTLTCTPPSGSFVPVGITTVTCIATDAAGNQTDCSFDIEVIDTEPPSITCPSDVTVECETDVPPPNPGAVGCSDNCPGVAVTFEGEETDETDCVTTIERTYLCVDAAGLTAECTQIITVEDVTPPSIIGVPDDLELTCGDPVPPPATVMCEDNCIGVVSGSFNETVVGDCPQTITRTWTCTDACDNEAVEVQIITLVGIPGACCLPDGSCVLLAATICESQGGDFILEDIDCTPAMLGEPGTYLLGNHPDTSQAPPPYGLRLDDLFDLQPGGTTEIYTFDFEHPGAFMLLEYDGTSIRIYGVAFGGRDRGLTYDYDQTSFVAIDFTYSEVVTAPGDDDLIVVTPDAFNSGTLTWLETGEVIDLYDYGIAMGFTFRFGNEDHDQGHDGYPGLSGWGWLNVNDPDTHHAISDWGFTAEDLCPAPDEQLGPCCFDDDSCLLLTLLACQFAGGEPGLGGTTCETAPCGDPLGACCLFQLTPECEQLTEVACFNAGGNWLGADTPCDDCLICGGCPATAWQDPGRAGDWPYEPTAAFADMFEDAFPGMTLAEVLARDDSVLDKLGRQAVAALLNAATPEMVYPMSAAQVVNAFNEVHPGSRSEHRALARHFETRNTLGCPLLAGDPGADTGGDATPGDGPVIQSLHPVQESAPAMSPPGDLDGDGRLGDGDIVILLDAVGTTETAADLDGDGTVTGADLIILLETMTGENGPR